MKKILGLDIGTTSIGWAIVEASDQKPIKDNNYFKEDAPETKTDTNNQRTGLHYKNGLPAVGVRIITQGKMGSRFDTGKKLNEKKEKTPTKERRDFRSARKTKSRYKLRRDKICSVLDILEMLPDGSYEKVFKNGKEIWRPIEKKNNQWYTNNKGRRKTDIGESLYKLRNEALNSMNEISLKDWGRILLHLNQWRGYSSDRFSSNEEELDKDFHSGTVMNISNEPLEIRYEEDDPGKVKWKRYEVEIEFETPVTIEEKNNDEVTEKTISSLKGNLYVQDLKFEKDDLITFSFEILKNETKIKYIQPKPESTGFWKYKYFLLNKDLKSWCKDGGTVGSYFYNHHSGFRKTNENADLTTNKILSDRIRNIVVNRKWYEDEFDKIWKAQFQKYKDKFTDEIVKQCIDAAFRKDESVKKELLKLPTPEAKLKALIRNKIIYYQRSWQQGKNKGECRFEKIPDIKKNKDGKIIPHKDGKEHWKGRTVIPRSHPLHQEFKIWQQINNVRIWFHPIDDKEVELMENATLCKEKLGKTPTEIKELLYERLQHRKEQSWRTFVNEIFPSITIKLKKADNKKSFTKEEHYSVNYIKLSKKKDEQDNPLKGNKTKVQIQEILKKGDDSWYDKNAKSGKDSHNIEKIKGKSVSTKTKGNIEFSYQTKQYQISNLQLLWEIIYDITGFHAGNEKANIELITKKIRNHFDAGNITDEQCTLLAKIKFDDSGMGNLSAKAIRKMLPLMACRKYAEKYPLNEKVRVQIDKLIDINQKEQNETNDDLKLYSLKEFIPDKKARIKLSEKMSIEEFKGLNYWEAAAVVYGNHSRAGVTNRTEDEIKEAVKNLLPVKPSSMNNPVVEKIVNETLKMVQLLYNTYGFDELRIELSRELKNGREEREAIWEAQKNNRLRNEFAKKMLREMFNGEDTSELDLKTSNRNIEKIKIIEDVVSNLKPKEHAEKKKEYKVSEPTKADIKNYRLWLEQNFKCPYTDTQIAFSDIFSKNNKVEREHVIPRERYPDNSYSNIVLTWKEINSAKSENGNRTAYEFIVSKRDRETVFVEGKGQLSLISKDKWEKSVTEMFGKGRKAKNLLRKSISEDPINRELKDTQYINKKLREKLGDIFGFDKVWTSTGQITDMLRDSWHLNEKVMQELLKDRFEKFKPPMGTGVKAEKIPEYSIIYPNTIRDEKTNQNIVVSKFPGYHKRLDHRHHAMDAIIVACTRQQHIQYINNLNAANYANIDNDDEKKQKYNFIKKEICEGNSSTKYKTPWQVDEFMKQVKGALQQIIVSHKNSNVLISPSKNKEIDEQKQKPESIRYSLHNETLIGKKKIYDNELVPIEQIVEMIFEQKNKLIFNPAKSETDFTSIIKSIIFKEKFQSLIIDLFNSHISITNANILKETILKEIETNKEKYFERATTFKIKYGNRSSSSISSKDLKAKNILDFRTQRYVEYRQELIKEIEAKYKGIKESQERKNVNNFTDYPVHYNALYDVRVKDTFRVNGTKLQNHPWLPLFEYKHEMLDSIEYSTNKRTEQIKKLLMEYQFDFNKENILLKHQLFADNNRISIKHVTIENRFGKEDSKSKKKNESEDDGNNEVSKNILIEIRPKTFVKTEAKFRVIVTEEKDSKEKHFKYIDHLTALNYKKELIDNPGKESIEAEFKIPIDKIPPNDNFLFTLSKNDLVYVPKDILETINWGDIKLLTDNLFLVSSFDEKNNYVVLQKHTTAEPIKLNDKIDASGLAKELQNAMKKQEDGKKEYEEAKSLSDEKKSKHLEWKKSLNKEDLRFQKNAIAVIEKEIKDGEKLLKEHKKELDELEKQIRNLETVIAFKPKDDKPAPPIEESVEIKNDNIQQKLIKVFTDKLGKKVVPYWQFEKGCWNKKDAERLGLIKTNK